MNLTTRTRKWVRTWIPLEDLLPDQLPAFVRSPAYFFGVTSLSSLVLLIASGFILAAFGPQWWHNSGVGHFVNSLHFWSAQVFFFSLTLHLWTEFSKGAWRHGRRLTWVVGALTFVVAIGTAFTGYLAQTNFDAQWIAVEGKDAMNAMAIGSFFNLLNFGQMYGFHIVLLPLLVVVLVGGHVLQVRIRGVVRPYAASIKEERAREELWGGGLARGWSPLAFWRGPRDPNPKTRPLASDQVTYYQGIRMDPYDLLREGLVALVVVAVFAFVFAALFSSPDDPPMTVQSYALQDPVGFLSDEVAELSGTSTIAQYGPPYNNQTGSVQFIGPVSLQNLAGVTLPLDTKQVYVLQPLAIAAETDPSIAVALHRFTAAPAAQQATWEKEYIAVLKTATVANGVVMTPPSLTDPLPVLMGHLLSLGQSGALDGLLLRSHGFYQDDFTKPLLFLSESALPARATALHLLGTQWGMMNETGNYPGQAWLWLYTFWYQVPPYSTSPNADALVWVTTGIVTLALILLPYIPYLNRLPYYLGIHRLIWREYYREEARRDPPPPS